MKLLNICISINVILLLSVHAIAGDKTERTNYTECLKSISDNSSEFKGKIFPTSSDGWSYVVSDVEKKETTIFLENGEVFKISSSGLRQCKNVTTDETKGSSGAKVVYSIYTQALKDKKTPLESQKKIVERCKEVVAFANLPAQTGFPMGGVAPTSGRK